jgi:hypothetical protein
MARYFFSTEDGSCYRDKEGTELKDLSEARVEAIRYAGQVMTNEPGVLWNGQDFHVYVTDEQGTALFKITSFATNAPAADGVK